MLVRIARSDQGSKYMATETGAIPNSDAPPAGATMQSTLRGEAYRSEEFFALERERIFFSEWTCVGREETIAEAGSYLLVDLLGESLLVVRTRAGAVRAFHNVC